MAKAERDERKYKRAGTLYRLKKELKDIKSKGLGELETLRQRWAEKAAAKIAEIAHWKAEDDKLKSR